MTVWFYVIFLLFPLISIKFGEEQEGIMKWIRIYLRGRSQNAAGTRVLELSSCFYGSCEYLFWALHYLMAPGQAMKLLAPFQVPNWAFFPGNRGVARGWWTPRTSSWPNIDTAELYAHPEPGNSYSGDSSCLSGRKYKISTKQVCRWLSRVARGGIK